LTVVLLVAGALVTSNEAGDSVPDWPLSFGRWLIDSDYFVANVRYEYSHRVIAAVVGLATGLLALLAWKNEQRRWVRRLAFIAFGAVVAQALVGGVRVLFPSWKPIIALPHALAAQSFLGLVVTIAVVTSRGWFVVRQVKPDEASPPLRTLTRLAVAAVLVQLVLGAGFRHQTFGIIPHIAGAVVVTFLVIWTVTMVLRQRAIDSFLRRPALAALALLIVQLALGVGAYLARLASAGDPQPLEPMISLTVAHVVVGALTLVSLVVLMLRCHRSFEPRRRLAEVRTASREAAA
jgi:cytochrome c oxidase assembly protein subunit 15